MPDDYVESNLAGPKEGGDSATDTLQIEDVIADLAVKQVRLSAYIDDCLDSEQVTPDQVARLIALHGQNAARLGRLLRDQKALGGRTSDALSAAIDQALAELSKELGVKL